MNCGSMLRPRSHCASAKPVPAGQQRVVAEGDSVIVLLDGAGNKTPLTDDLKARIHALEVSTSSR